jgi:phosphatidylglycerophosphate synthase
MPQHHTSSALARRPLRSRGWRPVRRAAARLAGAGVAPDAISAAGLAAALAAAGCLLAVPASPDPLRVALLLAAAGLVGLRLLANVLDGLVAIEGGRRSALGDLCNEVPDRIADAAVLVAAGYAVTVPALGWAAALLAVLTAYVRLLGGALGLPQSFAGPMAKPQRMLALIAATLLSVPETLLAGYHGRVLLAGLAIVAAGTLLTAGRRLAILGRDLRDLDEP